MVADGLWIPPNMGGGGNGPNNTNLNTDGIAKSAIGSAGTIIQNVCKVKMEVYICPSDNLPDFDNDGYAKTNYLGNNGTYPGLSGHSTATGDPRLASWKGQAQNGIFLYANDNDKTWVTRLADVTDGTSNTLMVGETTETLDLKATNAGHIGSCRFPIWAGGNPGGCNGLSCGSSVFRLAGCEQASVLANNHPTEWTINRKAGQESNESFCSKHPGGAQFCLADASVRFVAATVASNVYSSIATRALVVKQSRCRKPVRWGRSLRSLARPPLLRYQVFSFVENG